MSLMNKCEICGANLDPGEKCDCTETVLPAIRCDQPPVIAENLDSVKQSLRILMADISTLPRNDESLKHIKKVRANLTKEFERMEEQRKAVKKQIMEPYIQAEEKYKAYISGPYKAADDFLKGWVDGYQDELKGKCEAALRQYFKECCQSLQIDFLKFEDCGVVVDMAMARQKTPSKAIDKVFDFVTAVRTDLDVIATFDNGCDILAEYKRGLSLQEAIATVTNRKKEEEAAQAFLEARKQQQLETQQHIAALMEAAPEIVPEPEERFTVAFSATGTIEALKAMKAYGMSLGITFEDIEQEEENDE